MARVTIYLPDELKTRMDRVGSAPNWSAAAQRAFAGVLEEEEWKGMSDQVERAAARLRQSRQSYLEDARRVGRTDGREWALETAEYGTLDRLERHAVDRSGAFRELSAEALAVILVEEEMEPAAAAREWWGESLPPAAYVAGYVQGAVEAFREIKALA